MWLLLFRPSGQLPPSRLAPVWQLNSHRHRELLGMVAIEMHVWLQGDISAQKIKTLSAFGK
jgi:hypothetical protein